MKKAQYKRCLFSSDFLLLLRPVWIIKKVGEIHLNLIAKIFMDPTVHELQFVCASEIPSGGKARQNHVYLTLLDASISV